MRMRFVDLTEASRLRASRAPDCRSRLLRWHRQLVSAAQPDVNDWQWASGDLLATRAADFRPNLKCLGPGSFMLGGSDIIAAEVEQVIDLIVG